MTSGAKPGRPASAGPQRAHRPRILIVEDDAKRAALLCRALEPGYACTEVASADEAFVILRSGEWCAAVVDYDLKPGGSGLEVLQGLREHTERTLRILYSTFYNDGLVSDARRLAHAHAVLDARRRDFLLSVRRALAELLDPPVRPPERVPAAPCRAPAAAWCALAERTRAFLAELRRAAESERVMFVYGERGVGKRLATATFRQWRAAWDLAQPPRGTLPKGAGLPVLLEVPPLRERCQDVPCLAQHFLATQARAQGGPSRRLAPEALAELMRRDWRGNGAELHGVLRRALHNAGGRDEIGASELPRDLIPPRSADRVAKDEGQRDSLLRQLRAAGSVRSAARLAGMTRPNYMRLMKRLGIMRADASLGTEDISAES